MLVMFYGRFETDKFKENSDGATGMNEGDRHGGPKKARQGPKRVIFNLRPNNVK